MAEYDLHVLRIPVYRVFDRGMLDPFHQAVQRFVRGYRSVFSAAEDRYGPFGAEAFDHHGMLVPVRAGFCDHVRLFLLFAHSAFQDRARAAGHGVCAKQSGDPGADDPMRSVVHLRSGKYAAE